MSEPSAFALLRSSLAGMDALFSRVPIHGWHEQVRLLLELADPQAMAAGYRATSAGSAPGTLPAEADSC